MEAVINAALPVFALILAGYLAARFAILGHAATDSINRFVVYLALPALLFQAMATIAGRQLANLHFLLALPIGTGPFMLAKLYDREAALTSRAILISTLCSVVSVSLLIVWLTRP